jgi:nitrite reductase (NADH) small subunit
MMRAAKSLPSPCPSPCHGERESLATSLAPKGGEGLGEGQQHWTRICASEDIPRLGARVVRRGIAPNVAIFRTAEDKFFGLADRCPHRGGPWSQGIVFGERVACPLHNTCVDLDTGCAVAPDKGEVQGFDVKVTDGHVYVDLHGR